MVVSSKHKSSYCEFYDRRTHRCVVDGTSWCAFPTSNYCDLALGEQGRRDSIPTVIRALLETSYPKQDAPILPKLAIRKIGAN
jgi:hypothetical protein